MRWLTVYLSLLLVLVLVYYAYLKSPTPLGLGAIVVIGALLLTTVVVASTQTKDKSKLRRFLAWVAVMSIVAAVTIFTVFWTGRPVSVPEPVVVSPRPTQIPISAMQRVVLFMGPMKSVNVEFESDTFDSPVSVGWPNGDQTVLYYEDYRLEIAGQGAEGVTIDRSNSNEWVYFAPDGDMQITVGGKTVTVDEDDVLVFNLAGLDTDPSIVMDIWRDGVFDKQKMHVFFEESDYEPVQRIPNWILEILNDIDEK